MVDSFVVEGCWHSMMVADHENEVKKHMMQVAVVTFLLSAIKVGGTAQAGWWWH